MISNLPLQCQCGLFRGVISGVASEKYNRFACLCDDCQTYALWLGKQVTILDKDGGTEVVPIVPPKLKIIAGKEFLKCVKLSPKGLDRWYAGCCKTPIGNTPNAKVPYVGVVHSIIYAEGKTREDLLGPLVARVQSQFGKKPLLKGTSEKMPLKVMLWMIRFMIPAFLKKQNKPSEFYTEEGAPIVEPYVLKKEERESLRAQTGSALKF